MMLNKIGVTMNKQKLINTITAIIILGIISVIAVSVTLLFMYTAIKGLEFILNLIMMMLG